MKNFVGQELFLNLKRDLKITQVFFINAISVLNLIELSEKIKN